MSKARQPSLKGKGQGNIILTLNWGCYLYSLYPPKVLPHNDAGVALNSEGLGP